MVAVRGRCAILYREVNRNRRYYSGFAMIPHAIRGGALLDAPVATAWITIAVPPLLKTEWSSVPSVTFGATTLAWAVPSAATISAKSGMSPAGSPPWSA
jgi:hypothetical protein